MADKPETIGAPFIVNGMGEIDNGGSYVALHVVGASETLNPFRREYHLSQGQAESLAAELNALALRMRRA